jgi:hypothetical protein
MTIFNIKHPFLLMIVNIQKFCSKTYNTSLNTIKGKKECRDRREYNVYNLSILLCWLLRPTKKYGCKSLIARHHSCKHMNRVFRLIKFYESSPGFNLYVKSAMTAYKIKHASH